MAAKVRRVLTMNLPFEQMIPVVEQAIINSGAQITNADRPTGRYLAKKGVSLTSWGEKICVAVSPSQNGCIIDVSSECALPTQIIDWGRNENNIRDLATWLNKLLNQPVFDMTNSFQTKTDHLQS